MTSGLADLASDGDLYLASEVQSNVANAREPLLSLTVRLPAIGARPPDFWRLPLLCYLCVCVGVLPLAVSRLGLPRRIAAAVPLAE